MAHAASGVGYRVNGRGVPRPSRGGQQEYLLNAVISLIILAEFIKEAILPINVQPDVHKTGNKLPLYTQ
jgi:hypothetical protein